MRTTPLFSIDPLEILKLNVTHTFKDKSFLVFIAQCKEVVLFKSSLQILMYGPAPVMDREMLGSEASECMGQRLLDNAVSIETY